ncbi:response regulator [Psychromonas aquimarina]|uniref:response regulator n=1 Tax=Psychromonas aquimarina TaxID=444919 RepID=UPI0004158A18|nr:response regulator [Psychromonas aquimarina]
MLKNKKYLIIDDFETAIAIMRTMLNSANVTNDDIDSTTDSMKAIRLLANHKYDVVLCDYNMRHHIDGGLIFDEVKQRKLIPSDAVFICVTGDNSEAVVTHFIELELDDYLLKPFRFSEFIGRIERVVIRKTELSGLLQSVENKDYQSGLDFCAIYRGLYPNYSGYINRINGDCLLRLKRHNDARIFYEQACKNTELAWPQIGLGQALQGLGELDKAESIFQKILTKHPKQPLARRSLAHCMMMRNETPQALAQFNILHKVNPANPLRELIIANLYAVLQEHEKAAYGYQRFIAKVTGTSRYSSGITVNISISLLLASLYTYDNKEHADLVNEARHNIYELNSDMEKAAVEPDTELSILTGFGILACLEGDIKNCFIVASKIETDSREVTDFYTVLNMARLYGFCGMPDLYEKAMLQARKLCGQTDDDVLMLSLVKLLDSCQKQIKQRLKNGKKLTATALVHRQNNRANQAAEDAYKAFTMVPFHFQPCLLILELTALSTPAMLSPAETRDILESCYWVYCNDKRPSYDEKKRAKELFDMAIVRVGKVVHKKMVSTA